MLKSFFSLLNCELHLHTSNQLFDHPNRQDCGSMLALLVGY